MTPHIEASLDEIAPIVLMPGDPVRAENIAKKYLKDYKLVNKVRGELAFTGYYKNKKVTIFSSGMGIPSMGIYSYELFKHYNVEAILRIGTAGSYKKEVNVGDIILAESSYSTGSYSYELDGKKENILYSDKVINAEIENVALRKEIKIKKCRVYSTLSFYSECKLDKLIKKQKIDVVEMETFSLFKNAQKLGKKASALLAVSDSFVTKEEMTREDREKNLDELIILALESIIKL